MSEPHQRPSGKKLLWLCGPDISIFVCHPCTEVMLIFSLSVLLKQVLDSSIFKKFIKWFWYLVRTENYCPKTFWLSISSPWVLKLQRAHSTCGFYSSIFSSPIPDSLNQDRQSVFNTPSRQFLYTLKLENYSHRWLPVSDFLEYIHHCVFWCKTFFCRVFSDIDRRKNVRKIILEIGL